MQYINNFPLLVEMKDARLLREERDREDPAGLPRRLPDRPRKASV